MREYNPYTPGAGFRPTVLAGREKLTEQVDYALENLQRGCAQEEAGKGCAEGRTEGGVERLEQAGTGGHGESIPVRVEDGCRMELPYPPRYDSTGREQR